MNFHEEMNKKVHQVEAILQTYLPKQEGLQERIIDAMNYSILVGGKRLRPLIMQETYQMFGGDGKVVEPFMAALEMIHTYSLVHDDLPAMDNDLYRRGKPTTHAKYGEALAILAGDGLLNFAYETAAKAFMITNDESAARAFAVLAQKAGIYGMVGGQTVDVISEKEQKPLNMEEIMFVHAYKTAALLQAAFMVGAILAGATDEQIACMEQIGYNVGIAFQIQDDILDVTASFDELGKPIGSDKEQGKVTYVDLKGLKESAKDVEALSKEALTLLEAMPGDHTFVEALITDLITRRK